jgi:hypothetical protein
MDHGWGVGGKHNNQLLRSQRLDCGMWKSSQVLERIPLLEWTRYLCQRVIFYVVRDFGSRTERGMTIIGIRGREYVGSEFGESTRDQQSRCE